MFRVTLICEGLGIPALAAQEAARDITKEFAEHRHWHHHVSCSWDCSRLVLVSENDFDENGLAAWDEFDDCITAYIKDAGDCETRVLSVSKYGDRSA
jgi:hypothetical protein